MVKKIRILIPIFFTVFLFVFFYFKRLSVIKFYPPLMNSFIFIIFFSSLFAKETIIQKFARIMNKGALSKKELLYTRNLTYVWCVFLFLNLLVSILTIFMSDKIWMVYNGCISYFLIGMVFIIEYPIRLLYRRKYNL